MADTERVADTRRLQQISTGLIRGDDLGALYEDILDAAVAIMRAQFGSMQLLHPQRGAGGELELLTHRGFSPRAAAHWRWVGCGSPGTCGRALGSGARAIISDVETCPLLAGSEDLAVFRDTGIRAMQTTPLRARDGRLLGMLSTHWAQPWTPAERELALLDVVARQVADLVEHQQAAAALRQAAARDAFRVALTDALRPLTDPAEVQAVVTRQLAEHLDVDRALYGEVLADGDTVLVEADACRGGAASVAGAHSIRSYGDYASEALLQGRPLVEPDVLQQPRANEAERARHIAIGARAHIDAPLFKDGRIAAVLSVHQAAPREWRADEVALVVEVAERAWAAVQRARAELAQRRGLA
jgi:GAF domain-containing protein